MTNAISDSSQYTTPQLPDTQNVASVRANNAQTNAATVAIRGKQNPLPSFPQNQSSSTTNSSNAGGQTWQTVRPRDGYASSEEYVTAQAIREIERQYASYASEQNAKTISWSHGTYRTGAQAANRFPLTDSFGSHQNVSRALRSYSGMVNQGRMPTSLAPAGTGISIFV